MAGALICYAILRRGAISADQVQCLFDACTKHSIACRFAGFERSIKYSRKSGLLSRQAGEIILFIIVGQCFKIFVNITTEWDDTERFYFAARMSTLDQTFQIKQQKQKNHVHGGIPSS